MVSLEAKLLHPETKKPYVRNRIGGINNSPEGRAVSFPSVLLPQIGLLEA
jgi:hypothetical protein